MSDAEKIVQFGELVEASERLSNEILRPWKFGCAVLGAALVASLATVYWMIYREDC